jgi:sugar phosphate isomerase/epimerase
MPHPHPILLSCVQFDAALKAGAMAVAGLAPIAARLGVDGVEYRDVYWRDKASEAPAVRDQIERLGLRTTYATFTPLFSADPAARRQLLTDIDDAASLGSPLLRVFIGVRDLPAGPEQGPEVWAGARAAVERAGERGLRLALENHINVLGPRWMQIRDVLLALDSPVMGTNIDTSNYVQNGEPLLTAIAELTPWIIYSHLKDLRTVDGQRTVVPLGRGDLDFAAILAAYARVGTDFPLCFEFPGGDDPEAAIAGSLAHVRRVMRDA